MKNKIIILSFVLFFLSCIPKVIKDVEACIEGEVVGHHIPKRTFPDSLWVKVYPSGDSIGFPEEKELSRYHNRVGLAISGGGFRSYSAALGQVSALIKRGIYDDMGTMSVLSGASWFSAPFNYADSSIPDEKLLGGTFTYHIDSLTPENIKVVHEQSIAYGPTIMSNDRIIESLCQHQAEKYPEERLFCGILQNLLEPYGCADDQKFFAANKLQVLNITQANPELLMDDFYYMRENRMPFVVSATLFDTSFNPAPMSHFEYTPLYCGTAETAVINDQYRGGGYVASCGYNSKSPGEIVDTIPFAEASPHLSEKEVDDLINSLVSVKESDLAEKELTKEHINALISEIKGVKGPKKYPKPVITKYAKVPFPKYPFTLFDMIGTSGSAPGSALDKLGFIHMMSMYNYWPVAEEGAYKSKFLSFVDGGDLENLSLIPLLRRGFQKVVVFENCETSLGSEHGSYRGVNYDIARLFGHKPKHSLINSQNTQIFSANEFEAVRDGLFDTQAEKGTPFYIGKHTIVENPFGLTVGQEVEILWIFNDRNERWYSALPDDMKALFDIKKENLKSLPHYKTVFHNSDEMFQLTPTQVNLMAHMWHWAIENDSIGNVIDRFVDSSL